MPKRFKMTAEKKAKKTTKLTIPKSLPFTKEAFPKTNRKTLKFSDLSGLPIVIGFGAFTYRANDIFDPNRTGIGRQPHYFDQLMALYNHFIVLKSRIKVTIMSVSDQPHVFTLLVDDDGGSAPTAVEGAERPGAKSVAVIPADQRAVVLTHQWDLRKVFGDVAIGNPDYTGNISSGPSEESVYHILGQNVSLATEAVSMHVEMEFDVEFTELKTVAQS